MLKIRITFVDDPKGNEELKKTIKLLEENINLISQSKVCKCRGKSKYSNIYLDVEVQDDLSR
ncbi:MAG: hypothetical protein ACRC41_16125 [Sarcina sp.]